MIIVVIAAVLLVAVLAVFAISYFESQKLNMTFYKIAATEEEKAKKEKQGIRFVVLADLHNHQFGKENEILLKKIREVAPDFVVSAGDILTARPGHDVDVALNLMEQLAKEYPVYYGNGNHEQRLFLYPENYPGAYEKYDTGLKQCGVRRLINETIKVEMKGHKIAITGLELERKYYKRFQNVEMDVEALEKMIGKKTQEYTILIAHNPEYFDVYADWGADLILSGHVHGGMVRLPFLGGVISPKGRLFPKYDAGAYYKKKSCMLLSRGLGMHTIPVRLWNRPEVLVVDLQFE